MRHLALLFLTGCAKILGIEDLPADAPVSDGPASMICEAVGARCTGDVLRECATVGAFDVTTECALGCLPDGAAHCGVLVPSADIAKPADTVPDVQLRDLTTPPNLSVTFNASTGEIDGIRGPGEGVIEGIGFENRDNAGVFRVRGLSIGDNARLVVVSNNAMVLIATEHDIVLGNNAQVDARGTCEGNQAGPGGFLGGIMSPGQGGGGGGGGNGAGTEGSGGGGGGHGDRGGNGGPGTAAQPGLGGPSQGDAVITNLVGGSGGGGGGAAGGGVGGGGGGALQWISNTAIRVGNNAAINAGGCGGKGGAGGAGGGGGAGGTLLLEAPIVSLTDLGVIVANGGGGGGGSTDSVSSGVDGQASADGASGGGSGTSAGGLGGARNTGTAGGDGFVSDQGGGGGGGVGRIRLTTSTPPAFPVTSIQSPEPSVGTLVVQ